MKKNLIILFFILMIVGTGVLALFLSGRSSSEDNSGVVTKQTLRSINTYVQDNTIQNYGFDVVLFYEDSRISMLNYAQTDSFLISIDTMTTLTDDIQYAEQTFLSTFNISESTACQLQVEIAVPHYADFQNDGVYGLRFCSGNNQLQNI